MTTSAEPLLPGNFRNRPLIVGTRKSKLALWQTARVCEALVDNWPELRIEIQHFTTTGDQVLDSSLSKIGQKGLFTAELDSAILNGKIDLAIHSLKDLPTQPTDGLQIMPLLPREDPRDIIVSKDSQTLSQLKPNAVIGTSSFRRQSQLLALRADLRVQSVRGNVPTRIDKVSTPEYDAIVLAAAGVKRLQMDHCIAEWLPLEDMLPAPGQGAMAATFRSGCDELQALLASLRHPETSRCVEAERAFLAAMGGGCSSPIAAWCRKTSPDTNSQNEDDCELTITGRVASLDGREVITKEVKGFQIAELAGRLAKLILDSGGQEILDAAKPLHQKRVLVTRSAEQSGSLEEMLREQGAIPIALPLIQFRRLEDRSQLEHLDSFDWILFTSSNAIRYFIDLLGQKKSRLNNIQLGCVGSQTAKTLREHDLVPDFVPAEFSSERLAEEIKINSGQRVLYPCPLNFNPKLPNSIREIGAEVVTWPIYETLQVDLQADALSVIESGIEIVTFASPSVVSSFCEQVPNYKAKLADSLVTCIGPMTRRKATELGISVDIVPEEFTVAGMVSALVKNFGEDCK